MTKHLESAYQLAHEVVILLLVFVEFLVNN